MTELAGPVEFSSAWMGWFFGPCLIVQGVGPGVCVSSGGMGVIPLSSRSGRGAFVLRFPPGFIC